METGCQNVQLCLTILKVAFAPEIIGPLYFFPLLYLLFQLGEGLLLILVFRIHDRIKKPSGEYSFAPVFLTLSSPNHICLHIITKELLLSRRRIRLPFKSVTVPNALIQITVKKSYVDEDIRNYDFFHQQNVSYTICIISTQRFSESCA